MKSTAVKWEPAASSWFPHVALNVVCRDLMASNVRHVRDRGNSARVTASAHIKKIHVGSEEKPIESHILFPPVARQMHLKLSQANNEGNGTPLFYPSATGVHR